MILALGNGIPFFLIELARIMGCHYSMCGHVAFHLVPHLRGILFTRYY
jgi:hypothetical protein